MTLREQMARTIMLAMNDHAHEEDIPYPHEMDAADAVLVVFAEREQVLRRKMLEAFLTNGVYAERWKVEERARLRERIEALPSASPPGPIVKAWLFKADVLRVFDDES